MRTVVRRILHGVALLIAVSVLTFGMAELAPGDFLDVLRLDASVSDQTIDRLSRRYGLDDPVTVRYVRWLGSVFRGEFGFSVAHQTAAGPLLLPRARNTLTLAGAALLLVWGSAVPLGVWSAHGKGGALDRMLLGISSVLLATPTLVLGLVLLLIAGRSGFFPIGGMTSLDHAQLGWLSRAGDLLLHLALPALAMALAGFPVVFRHVRSALSEVLESDFLKAGKAQGVPLASLLFRHALKAAANPLISLFGLSIAGLLSGSLLIEVIMSWPGLGPLMLESILARDVHVVVGAVLLSSLFLVGGNLLADLLLLWIDPRTREA